MLVATRIGLAVVALAAAFVVGRLSAGSNDPSTAGATYNAGYRAGREAAFAGYDGGWVYGVPYRSHYSGAVPASPTDRQPQAAQRSAVVRALRTSTSRSISATVTVSSGWRSTPRRSSPGTGVRKPMRTPRSPLVANVSPRSVIARRAGPPVLKKRYGPVGRAGGRAPARCRSRAGRRPRPAEPTPRRANGRARHGSRARCGCARPTLRPDPARRWARARSASNCSARTARSRYWRRVAPPR